MRAALGALLLAVTLSASVTAQAQIDRPGAHVKYKAEIEPHLVIQWADEPYWTDDGIGVGVRASIPLVDNGPVPSINNNMGIGIGFDWAHFDDGCYFRGAPNVLRNDCEANDFWIPVVMQWNFFFSDLVSAFFELGLGIQYTDYDFVLCNNNVCYGDDSDIDLELVIGLGMRLHLSSEIALTLRLGRPSVNLGASFFL